MARSTFRNQNLQSAPASDHFWKLRCRKSTRRYGAKHISKSKCTKRTSFGPLLEITMSKKYTPLWREIHFEIKIYKTHQLRTTFRSYDVEKIHVVIVRSTFRSQNSQNATCSRRIRATFGSSDLEKVHAVVAQNTFRNQNLQNTRGSEHFWRFKCRFASLRAITLHYTLHYTTVHYTTLHNTTTTTTKLHNYTPLHSTTLNYNTLHHITLHSTTLHYTTLYTPLHYITLHYTLHTLQYITLHYTPQYYNYNYNYTPLHTATLNYTTLYYTTLERSIDK